MEAKAYYDLETIDKKPNKPSWLRRLGFLASLILLGGFIYREMYPYDFRTKMSVVMPYIDNVLEFIVVNGQTHKGPFVHKLVPE